MNKVRWLLISPLLVIVAFMGYFVVDANSDKGEFVNVSHTGAHAKVFNEYLDVYIGHTYKWTGETLPTIEGLEIIKDDGSVLTETDPSIYIETFIDPNNQTDLYYGFSPDMREVVGEYEQPDDFNMTENEMTVVFKVTMHEQNYQFDLSDLKIQYQINNESKQQTVPLKSFVFHH
ncbi:hypothetical protein [Alkalibacillus almallahensis]|uniref:hypothetical protein n=1 Tax=Alkalibacillus almallahensis TaxID=1379154 RepID=UPI00141EC07D|nr:hypothetical protein [Alkalibacillus almallahensis]NIK11919.1 hypothetical protein [Alkalibacillus almallahensis]